MSTVKQSSSKSVQCKSGMIGGDCEGLRAEINHEEEPHSLVFHTIHILRFSSLTTLNFSTLYTAIGNIYRLFFFFYF
ncbi:hypothetical protein RJT34_18843 [Clitoria ternatea]|uniref:Uncharacterized protein n=1 Tax=Clitoria ternatea TaxID=43366 RepID=A0AAN9P3S2_CLITE